MHTDFGALLRCGCEFQGYSCDVFIQQFVVDLWHEFTHIIHLFQYSSIGTCGILWLSQCHGSNQENYEWGPQVGPVLAPWTLLSGITKHKPCASFLESVRLPRQFNQVTYFADFCHSAVFPIFHYCQTTLCILNITFIYDRRRKINGLYMVQHILSQSQKYPERGN